MLCYLPSPSLVISSNRSLNAREERGERERAKVLFAKIDSELTLTSRFSLVAVVATVAPAVNGISHAQRAWTTDTWQQLGYPNAKCFRVVVPCHVHVPRVAARPVSCAFDSVHVLAFLTDVS